MFELTLNVLAGTIVTLGMLGLIAALCMVLYLYIGLI